VYYALCKNEISCLFIELFVANILPRILHIPYILESNLQSVFCDFLNGKKLVCNSNPHLSFNRLLPTGRLIE